MTLTNAEVIARLPQLAEYKIKADSGTTTTLTSSIMIDEPNIVGSYLCFTSGDLYGTDRIVTDFDIDFGSFTFDELPASVTNTDEVCVTLSGFQTEIKQADIYIQNYIRNKKLDFNLLLDKTQLKEAHIYMTLSIICANKMKDAIDADVYFVLMNKYDSLYEIEMSKLVADYDANEDGVIDESEQDSQIGQIRFDR